MSPYWDGIDRRATYLIRRLREPSSWATIFTTLAAVGLTVPPSILQQASIIGAGLAGLIAFFMPEGRNLSADFKRRASDNVGLPPLR